MVFAFGRSHRFAPTDVVVIGNWTGFVGMLLFLDKLKALSQHLFWFFIFFFVVTDEIRYIFEDYIANNPFFWQDISK
jgi:hypothetical protein